MIPVIVVSIYLVIIAVIGSVAFRKTQANTEDFFLANRTVGSMVFFLSLFATNMTAFAILGSSGQAYRQGIGIYGLMASSSGLVIPLTIFFIGTRLWALGKRFGHQTQVAFFRDRWECSSIGTVIFALSVIMLVPYMIISIMGGGRVLADISGGRVQYALGCAVVALVVTANVFFGGMRGTVWVNIFQTVLFLLFGAVAVAVISHALPGGFGDYIRQIASNPKTSYLLNRERMPERYFWSYTLIPLSSIMFPHMAIMCFAAKKVTAFKRTVVLYPLAIMAIWLPCVFLGVLGTQLQPGLKNPDGILLHLLTSHAPVWLAGILGAGIISAVMGSDTHQVLAVSTMFTKDVFAHYGGKEKYGERGSVLFARGFILVVTSIAYIIALNTPETIFELAVRFAFSGFAAMSPVMIAALFWRRSTKWGALASTLWVAAWLALTWYVQKASDGIAPKPGQAPVVVFEALGHVFERSFANVTVYGFLPVVPMVLGSAVLMVLVSLVTHPPSRATIDKYFPGRAIDQAGRSEASRDSEGDRTAAPLHQPSS
jgi:SSS family solute:Na+ symporter